MSPPPPCLSRSAPSFLALTDSPPLPSDLRSQATVNSVINLGALHGDIKLGDLLDTTAPGLCYEYADPPSSA